jgi:hypothetical protein
MGTTDTGDCYQSAVDTAMLMDRRLHNTTSIRVVHGMVDGQASLTGTRFDHAWVEVGDALVYDNSNGKDLVVPMQTYYAIGNIKEEELVRYSVDQTRSKLIQHKHYGPWDLLNIVNQQEKQDDN